MGKKNIANIKQKRPKKDKDAPKRPLSAYFFYIQERREALKKEKPNLDNKELIRTMGEEWNKLSDEEKKPYSKMAENDKKRYQDEIKAYEKKKK